MVTVVSDVPDPEIMRKTSCKNCAMRLEYAPVEVKTRKVGYYDGSHDIEDYIVCPNCGKQTTV